MNILLKEVPVYKNIFTGEIDRETERDLNLPDYCPDISRIIQVDATPYVEGCAVNGDTCFVNGIYVISVLYESDYRSTLAYSTFTIDFTEKIDIKNNCKECAAWAKILVRRIGCKLINPRKFLLRIRSAISATIKGAELKEIADVSAFDDSICTKNATYEWESYKKAGSFEFELKETFNISEKNASVEDVVFCVLDVVSTETTALKNGLKVKADVRCKMLYCGENDADKYIMLTKTFAADCQIDEIVSKENTVYSCFAKIIGSEISVDLDSYGENRVVDVSYRIKITVEEAAKNYTEYSTDAFSTKGACTTETVEFESLKAGADITKQFPFEARLKSDNVMFADLCDYNAKITECKLYTVENETYLKGLLTLSVLGETEDGYESFDFSESFEERISIGSGDVIARSAECTVTDANATLAADGSIDLHMMCLARIKTEQYIKHKAVCGIDEADASEKRYGLIFCFPDEKDTLWSVSKKYFTDPRRILSDNIELFSENGELVKKAPIKIIK